LQEAIAKVHIISTLDPPVEELLDGGDLLNNVTRDIKVRIEHTTPPAATPDKT